MNIHLARLALLSILMLPYSDARAEETPRSCKALTLTIGGALPRHAQSIFEMDKDEAEALTPADRPITTLSLDRWGFPGQAISLRFSRTEANNWIAEEISVTDSGRYASTVNTSPPIMFSAEGDRISRVSIQILPTKVSEAREGDRVFLAFDDLSLGEKQSTFLVSRSTDEPGPCFEPPRMVLTPQQSIDQMKIYPFEEGFKLMLNDVPTPEVK